MKSYLEEKIGFLWMFDYILNSNTLSSLSWICWRNDTYFRPFFFVNLLQKHSLQESIYAENGIAATYSLKEASTLSC